MNIKTLIMNKQIMLAIGMILFVGALLTYSTGAFFSDTAEATANAFTAGTLDLKIAKNSGSNTPTGGWLDTQTAPWNFAAMAPGGTPDESSVWLKNTGTVDGMKLGIAAANTETVSGYEKQVRITKLTFDGVSLLEGGVGANLAGYEAPTNCDIEVNYGNNDFASVSAALASATAGQVICVGAGNYTQAWETGNGGAGYPLQVSANNVTLASVDGAAATKLDGGIQVNNIGVTVTGFTIGHSVILNDDSGVFLNNAADNATISFNDIDGTGSVSGKGIITAYGQINGMTVTNNNIHDWMSGTWFNKATNSVYKYNTLTLNGNGINNDNPQGDDIQFNEFVNNSSTAFAALVSTADSVTFRNNDLANNVGGKGVSQWGNGSLDAQHNWWGDNDPSDQVGNHSTGNVDYSNPAGGPIAGFINGTDQNSNGYADMQDLRLTPIVGVTPGLDAGEQKRLIMAVQLDGPTTGNNFQGAGLTTDLTFTLNQI